MHLTKASIASLAIPVGKTDCTFFDDKLPGFGLRLRAGGRRTWIVMYRFEGRLRKYSLGNPDVVDVAVARADAKQIIALAQRGQDPQDAQAEKEAARARAVNTLGKTIDAFLQASRTTMKPRYYAEVERHLRRQWRPLHSVTLHRLSRAAILERLDQIAAESGLVAANRARTSLSAMFTWAKARQQIEHNPVSDVAKPLKEEKIRDRVLKPAELREIWACLGEGDYANIMRLLMHLCARRDEVGGMRWSEIDMEAKVWTIPPERAKNGVACALPLSPAVLEILESIEQRDGRDLLFGSREGPFSGWSKAKAQLDQRITEAQEQATPAKAKPIAPWIIHDLRRTGSTTMRDLLEVPDRVVEAILNHVSKKNSTAEKSYNFATYMVQKRRALEAWSQFITQAVAANK